jgi:hypothetical protein
LPHVVVTAEDALALPPPLPQPADEAANMTKIMIHRQHPVRSHRIEITSDYAYERPRSCSLKFSTTIDATKIRNVRYLPSPLLKSL